MKDSSMKKNKDTLLYKIEDFLKSKKLFEFYSCIFLSIRIMKAI